MVKLLMMSAMVKLAERTDELSSDVIGFGMVSNPMTILLEKVKRAMLSFWPS